MNIFGIGFLVMISLVGGLIALLADNLGRTIGKKRITVRKLRPRRTAQVFTFGAGALIPLLTVSVVAFASEGVRRWFIEGPQVIDQRDRLLVDVRKLGASLEQLEGQRKERAAEVARLTNQSIELAKRLKESQSKLAAAQQRVAELNAKLTPMASRLARAEKDFRNLSSTNEDLKAQNAAQRVQLAADRRRASEDLRRLQMTFNTLNSQKADAEKYQLALQKENDELARKNADLQTLIQNNESQILGLSANLKQATDEYNRKLAEIDRETELLEIQKETLEVQVRQAQAQMDALKFTFSNSRTLPMTFQIGEELARISVSANMRRDEAQNQLNRLLRSARSTAEQRGAKARGPIPAAAIMDRIDDNGRPVSSESQQQRIVDRMTGLSEEFVIVASSSLNAFQGEPISLEILSYRNPVVFTQGELVAETRIDGERSEIELDRQIQQFMTVTLQSRAKEAGMIPRLGGSGLFATLSKEQVYDLIHTAKANNRRVRLQALAPKDLRVGDFLELDYRIR